MTSLLLLATLLLLTLFRCCPLLLSFLDVVSVPALALLLYLASLLFLVFSCVAGVSTSFGLPTIVLLFPAPCSCYMHFFIDPAVASVAAVPGVSTVASGATVATVYWIPCC
jgi:hypothetical protein